MAHRGRIAAFPDTGSKEAYFAAYRAAMAASPTPRRSHDVATRFGTTRVYEHGHERAAPIVLLPAFWATSAMWAPNVAELAARHSVYCIDTIGQPGASVQTRPLQTPDDCAIWLDDVLTALDLRHVHLAGCSYGGWLAFNQSAHKPGRIDTSVLIEPANVLARPRTKFKLTLVALLPVTPTRLARRAMAWALGNPPGG